MTQHKTHTTGVVLMTYGSATTAEHVREYFEHIYPGKVSAELVKDFEERYRIVGGSPLVEIATAQAKLLEQSLGTSFVVRAGMRHSEPFIENAIQQCRVAGAEKLVGIILAPQFSSYIMNGYRKDFTAGARAAGFDEKNSILVGPWPDEAHFIALLAHRVRETLAQLEWQYKSTIPVIFTTHSLPKKVGYLLQLQATTDAVLKALEKPLHHYSAYQSAGHTPEAWLEPDLTDVLKDLKKEAVPAVLIVPIQFLCDHLEILYDLDIAARAQCAELDIEYHRTALPNTDARFIMSLHSLVTKNLSLHA